MSGVAVVTTAHGRHDHLRRQRVSLAAGTVVPDVHVVVAMDDPAVAGVAVGDGPPVEVLAVGRDPLGLPLATPLRTRLRRIVWGRKKGRYKTKITHREKR